MPGFTQIPNDVFDDPLWTSEKFTKAQAYADLYRLAQFKPGLVNKRGHMIDLQPGQIGWSQAELAKRWKRSVGWVSRLLIYLEKRQYIALQKSNVSSTITLLDWIKNDTANDIANGMQTESKRYTNNIVNTLNTVNIEKKESGSLSIKIWKRVYERFGYREDQFNGFTGYISDAIKIHGYTDVDKAVGKFLNDPSNDIKSINYFFEKGINKYLGEGDVGKYSNLFDNVDKRSNHGKLFD
jgi:hypothetical protein